MNRQLPPALAFRHAVSSFRNNLSVAFALSWPWYVFVIPVSMAIFLLAGSSSAESPGKPSGLTVVATLLVALITMISAASIAVNWHRYILRDELSPSAGAALRLDGLVWRYFGNVLLISLILFAVMFIAGLPLILIAAAGGAATLAVILIFIIVVPLVGTAFFRLAIKLPAVALGREDFSLTDAWEATRGNTLALFLLFLLNLLVLVGCVAILALLQAILSSLGIFGTIVEFTVQVALNWVLTIFSITILTSLYGFFVENRDF